RRLDRRPGPQHERPPRRDDGEHPQGHVQAQPLPRLATPRAAPPSRQSRGAALANQSAIDLLEASSMTHHSPSALLSTAQSLAASGVPVLPLRRGKVPFGNCPACAGNACGGRPNMKTPGPCRCPGVCHAWAAATTDPAVIASPPWAAAWRRAVCVGYHPGGAGLTVVDLDDADAVTWARTALPATRTVATTRGEHWIYRGTMASRNAVRPGVDIKSTMAYARYLGPGTGTMRSEERRVGNECRSRWAPYR